ncbi:putative TetR family transcriptional regulator [Nocardia brasiliensis ATCC] [Mycobacterium shimoidei]|uniref:Putative TetR family transcriptional regulator [Nocardia brasiliensis ATCC] n=1 Tax=Mycobacterium shimoidei TaxID=29313 RepID=A0A375Z4S0_MYCSH|nr:putative TetR family transcriptional regulator [Nocardia brasiliensis ATCC] [Mycobacterium shimoidei]
MCDAAIELLGAAGARGLSHPKVDQCAGVPAGTTSFYFRTRKALLQATAARLTELDNSDLARMSELAHDGSGSYSGTAGLATMVTMAGVEPWLTRTKARFELALQAGRDPELAETLDQAARRFQQLIREAVKQWQPAGTRPRRAVIDEQAFAALRFIEGVMLDYARGTRTTHSVKRIDRLIQAILIGVRDAPR